MPKSGFDTEIVRALARLLDEEGLSEVEVQQGEIRVRVARQATYAALPAAPAHAQPAPAAPAEAAAADHPGTVRSPMVGTVYLSAEPGAEAFVRAGDQVREGQTLLLLEAMKTFNEVRAPRSGKITRILVADGTPVEYGEPLVVIE